jgi:hypothetical protein
MTFSVFLSASIPCRDRDARYWETADVVAIRDSVRALVTAVVPRGQIIFGGHPAITPLIRLLIHEMAVDVRKHFILYQSRHFQTAFPATVADFEDVRFVEAVAMDEAASLEQMRRAMIGNHDFSAGIFLGGMEGVEQEFALFRMIHPDKPAYPIGSTGAAARFLFERYAPDRVELLSDLRYLTLFRRLLNITSG